EDVHAVPQQYKLPYRITVDTETIKPLVEAGRNREDFRPYKIIEKLGYSGSFVSEDFRKPDEKWVMRFLCGGRSPDSDTQRLLDSFSLLGYLAPRRIPPGNRLMVRRKTHQEYATSFFCPYTTFELN